MIVGEHLAEARDGVVAGEDAVKVGDMCGVAGRGSFGVHADGHLLARAWGGISPACHNRGLTVGRRTRLDLQVAQPPLARLAARGRKPELRIGMEKEPG
jgi:hypothetical protein